MRTLNKNKVKLWHCKISSTTDEVDLDGNYTGEQVITYTTPVAVYLNLYPASSDIIEELFGKMVQLDMLSVSTDVILTETSLLYITQPTSNYSTTYDYKVDKILHSLNSYQYGLKRRV